jgi:hypothetical protein
VVSPDRSGDLLPQPPNDRVHLAMALTQPTALALCQAVLYVSSDRSTDG